MNHQTKHYKLSRDTKHRKALIYNLIRSLVLYKKIKTTVAKAKCVKPIIEKLITKTKVQITDQSNKKDNQIVNDLANFRYSLAFFRNDEVVVKELINITKSLKNINGGYMKIVKFGQRKGDSANMAYLLFASKEIV